MTSKDVAEADYDNIAEKLVEDYLEGNITSLIELSHMLRDQAGLIISKSTLARRLKGKVNVRTGRKRKGYLSRKTVGGESDNEDGYCYTYTLSRNLNSTIVTVPVDEEHVRQYALVRTAGDGGKKYYRCNQCLKHRRNDKNTPQAYLIMENGKIVGNKHHKHHPLCKPTKRVEATTTSLDRENRKDIRIGRKTPKAAYAEGFYKAIDIASTEGSSGSDALPKVYPSWSRVRKSYFRQNRLGRLDRAKSLSAERHEAVEGEPILYAECNENGEYIIYESEEVPEGCFPISYADFENGLVNGDWLDQQRKLLMEEKFDPARVTLNDPTPNSGVEIMEQQNMGKKSRRGPSSYDEMAPKLTRDEKKLLARKLIDEVKASPNFKRQLPTCEMSRPNDFKDLCYVPFDQKGNIMVYESDQLYVFENFDGELEIACDPDADIDTILKNLKPYGYLS